MKKYIPAKMIRQSRFITFYDTWNKDEKKAREVCTALVKKFTNDEEYGRHMMGRNRMRNKEGKMQASDFYEVRGLIF